MARKTAGPCTHLRRLSASEQREANNRDRDGLPGSLAYMKERGYFDAWGNTRNIRYTPVIERLPWNPDAKPRIVAFRVEQFEDGHWLNGARVRSPKGKHYVKGVWIHSGWNEIARVQVPHWDYDGQSWEAREAWERLDADRALDADATHRKYEAGERRLWDIEEAAAAMEEKERWREFYADQLAEAAD